MPMISALPPENDLEIYDQKFDRATVCQDGILLAEQCEYSEEHQPMIPVNHMTTTIRLTDWNHKGTRSNRVDGGIMSIRRYEEGTIKLSLLAPITISESEEDTATGIGKLEINLTRALTDIWTDECFGRLADWHMQLQLLCQPFAAQNEDGGPDMWPTREGEPYSNSPEYNHFGGYIRLYNDFFMLSALPRAQETPMSIEPIAVVAARNAFRVQTTVSKQGGGFNSSGKKNDATGKPNSATSIILPGMQGSARTV